MTGITTSGYRAVLLDALGTLVELEPPWPLLQGTLAARHGIAIASSEAKQAMLVEMAYYRAHPSGRGRREPACRPAQALCARAEGPVAAGRISERRGDDGGAARLTALHSFSDAAPALAGLRAAGLRLAVVSNWDCSLRSVLAELDWRQWMRSWSLPRSARLPDAAIFLAALEQLRREPHEAVFVGDSLETDVLGARAAGLRALLLERGGAESGSDGEERVFSLHEVVELVEARAFS